MTLSPKIVSKCEPKSRQIVCALVLCLHLELLLPAVLRMIENPGFQSFEASLGYMANATPAWVIA
jgi:hypothetical protein